MGLEAERVVEVCDMLKMGMEDEASAWEEGILSPCIVRCGTEWKVGCVRQCREGGREGDGKKCGCEGVARLR